MESDFEILKQFSERLTEELKAVTGSHFSQTIENQVFPDGKGFEITASPYISVLIDGRAPTRGGATKGNPTLQHSILNWINAKGITGRPDQKGKIPTSTQLSWAMSTSIHRYGTKLYQRGGGNRIFDPIINEQRIDALFTLLTKYYLNKVSAISFGEKSIEN
jgi:hypothetical protein